MKTHCRYMATKTRAGFTLVEVAIVLVVLAILTGSLLVPLSAQMEQRYYDDTTRTMNDVRDALLGFTVVNKRLPCPDTDGDGGENVSGLVCSSAQGNLPWATLGIGTADAWGQPFLYRVTLAFANPNPAVPITLASIPDIRICQTAGCASTPNVVAVIVSKGKNQGTCTAACADEVENSNNNVTFVSRIRSQPGGGNEFDDALVWIPSATLFTRM